MNTLAGARAAERGLGLRRRATAMGVLARRSLVAGSAAALGLYAWRAGVDHEFGFDVFAARDWNHLEDLWARGLFALDRPRRWAFAGALAGGPPAVAGIACVLAAKFDPVRAAGALFGRVLVRRKSDAPPSPASDASASDTRSVAPPSRASAPPASNALDGAAPGSPAGALAALLRGSSAEERAHIEGRVDAHARALKNAHEEARASVSERTRRDMAAARAEASQGALSPDLASAAAGAGDAGLPDVAPAGATVNDASVDASMDPAMEASTDAALDAIVARVRLMAERLGIESLPGRAFGVDLVLLSKRRLRLCRIFAEAGEWISNDRESPARWNDEAAGTHVASPVDLVFSAIEETGEALGERPSMLGFDLAGWVIAAGECVVVQSDPATWAQRDIDVVDASHGQTCGADLAAMEVQLELIAREEGAADRDTRAAIEAWIQSRAAFAPVGRAA